MSCLASDPKLLNRIYTDTVNIKENTESLLDGSEDSPLVFSSILIEKGLVSADEKMRESFASAIRFIVESVRSPELLEQPSNFFTRLLLSKLDYVQHKAISRHTELFFVIMRELLPVYIDVQTGPQALGSEELVDPSVLIKETV